MKDVFKLIKNTANFKKFFVIFLITIVIAEGIIVQILPLLDREINAILETYIKNEPIDNEQLQLLFVIIFAVTIVYTGLNRISFFAGNLIRNLLMMRIFQAGFSKLIHRDLEYLNEN